MKEWGHTNKSKNPNEYTKYKPRLNTQNHSAQPGFMNWSW